MRDRSIHEMVHVTLLIVHVFRITLCYFLLSQLIGRYFVAIAFAVEGLIATIFIVGVGLVEWKKKTKDKRPLGFIVGESDSDEDENSGVPLARVNSVDSDFEDFSSPTIEFKASFTNYCNRITLIIFYIVYSAYLIFIASSLNQTVIPVLLIESSGFVSDEWSWLYSWMVVILSLIIITLVIHFVYIAFLIAPHFFIAKTFLLIKFLQSKTCCAKTSGKQWTNLSQKDFKWKNSIKIFTFVAVGLYFIGLLSLSLMSWIKLANSDLQNDFDDTDLECAHANCLLPYPSLTHMKSDSSSATGYRISIEPKVMPAVRGSNTPIPSSFWNERDGFSIIGPMIFTLEQDVLLDGIIGVADITSTSEQLFVNYTATILLDSVTGERVPHFIEIDEALRDPDQPPTIILQSLYPLEYGRRYIVGISGFVGVKDGQVLEASDSVKCLRGDPIPDFCVTDDAFLWTWKRYQADVFPQLISAGMTRDTIQLAWDFITISRDSLLGRMEWMRDDALSRIQDTYQILKVEDSSCSAPNTEIGRTIWGKFSAPSYQQHPGRSSLLTRDQSNKPFFNGFIEPTFVVRIPCSIISTSSKPSMIVDYGHGLLSDQGEITSSYLNSMANEFKWILFGGDWYGLGRLDLLHLVQIIFSDIPSFPKIPESIMQSQINQIVLMRMMTSNKLFAQDDCWKFGGVSVLETDGQKRTPFGYYGNSLGGILGGGFAAMTDDIERAVLGVPGAPLALLLTRSTNFAPFLELLKLGLYSQRDVRVMITMIQTLWDPATASGWLKELTQSKSPTVHRKQVLLQAGIGDSQVTNLGCHIMARAYGASTVAPQTRPLFGINERNALFNGSAIVEWNYLDVEPIPTTNIPPSALTNTHECPRRERSGQLQIRKFLQTGLVDQYCDGVCQSLKHC